MPGDGEKMWGVEKTTNIAATVTRLPSKWPGFRKTTPRRQNKVRLRFYLLAGGSSGNKHASMICKSLSFAKFTTK